jgi:hypothetical protein
MREAADQIGRLSPGFAAMNNAQRDCVSRCMKKTLQNLVLAGLMVTMGASCTTAYDAYGRPRTVVEPGAALLGVAAAGLVGYALANDGGGRHRGGHRHHRSYDRCYY